MRGLPIMTHPDLARWADYLRGLSAAGERRALRRHLDSGCQRCAARVAALAPVGVRNSEPPAGRHLLFETTEWTLDVSVESEADPAGSRAVAGICLGHESSPLVGAAVLAIMGERVVDRTRTGEIGEFQLTGLPSERLELWLVAGAGRPLVAEIDLATAGRPGGREPSGVDSRGHPRSVHGGQRDGGGR